MEPLGKHPANERPVMKTKTHKPIGILTTSIASLTVAGLSLTALADDLDKPEALSPAQTKVGSATGEKPKGDSKLPENKPFVQGLRGDTTLTKSQTKAAGRTVDTDPQEQTIQHVTGEHVGTEKFNELVEAADLGDFLDRAGKLTLFVPSDDAFDAIPQSKIDYLKKKENILELRALLKNHMAWGVVRSDQIKDEISLPNFAGREFTIGASADKVVVDNRAVVTTADLEATNGVIHIIDTVLTIPEDSVAQQVPIIPASQ